MKTFTKIKDAINAKLFALWTNIPFGYLLRFKSGRSTITLQKDLWVLISGNNSSDMLPLTLCSQELVDEITKRLKNKYNLKDKTNEH